MDPALATRPHPSHTGERRLYSAAAVLALALVFAGFARTYYLRSAFDGPPLTLLLYVHGSVMTSWLVLFIVQARLAARGHAGVHRRLGAFGALLALAVLVLGSMVAVTGARLGHSPPGAPPPLVFLAVPLGDMLVFALLVGAALWFRRRSDIHKRLMLLGCVGLLTAALARIPLTLLREGGIVAAFPPTLALFLPCVPLATIAPRPLPPPFPCGSGLIVVS